MGNYLFLYQLWLFRSVVPICLGHKCLPPTRKPRAMNCIGREGGRRACRPSPPDHRWPVNGHPSLIIHFPGIHEFRPPADIQGMEAFRENAPANPLAGAPLLGFTGLVDPVHKMQGSHVAFLEWLIRFTEPGVRGGEDPPPPLAHDLTYSEGLQMPGQGAVCQARTAKKPRSTFSRLGGLPGILHFLLNKGLARQGVCGRIFTT